MHTCPVKDPDLDFRRAQASSLLTMSRLRRALERRTELLLEEQALSITPAQANALMVVIQARSPITARRMAEDLGLSEATVSRFIRSLESDGWITRSRDPDDSRRILITATQLARAALPRFILVFNGVFDDVFTGFDREELVMLGRSIHRMLGNLRED